MAYFRHRRAQAPYQAAFRPSQQSPRYDEDGDRLYTEDDYAAAPEPPEDGDAFLPDDELLTYPDETYDQDPYEPQASPFAAPMDEEEADDPLDEELLTDEERAYLRRSHWQLISGLTDFAGVIVGTAVILILVALLVSLLNWLHADIRQTFTLWQMNL